MSKRIVTVELENETFGQRLELLRKSAGFSQRALATEIGISQRMVTYYENETSFPPTHILPLLAKALGVTTDQLLGIEEIPDKERFKRDGRLWRRFSLVEKLSDEKRLQVVKMLDNFLEREKLKEPYLR